MMNERIKQLAEQAEQYVNNAMDERAKNKDFTFGDIDEMYNKKFAELIVFECIKIAVFKGDSATGNAIKEHFGVEE